jgi:hypothetical protein
MIIVSAQRFALADQQARASLPKLRDDESGGWPIHWMSHDNMRPPGGCKVFVSSAAARGDLRGNSGDLPCWLPRENSVLRLMEQ